MEKMRILIVDDSSHVRRGVRCILESQEGWEVCGEAGAGAEAVELAERLDPDVVVMDISMPGMTGLEAIPHIHNIAPRSRVIILSIHESPLVVREAREAGAQGYVFKSDLDRDLINAVELVAQNQSFYPPEVAEMVASNGHRETGIATGKMEAKKSSDAPLASPGDQGGPARLAKAGRPKNR
jgi:DNA-binding NarL/FixJ family response regulator